MGTFNNCIILLQLLGSICVIYCKSYTNHHKLRKSHDHHHHHHHDHRKNKINTTTDIIELLRSTVNMTGGYYAPVDSLNINMDDILKQSSSSSSSSSHDKTKDKLNTNFIGTSNIIISTAYGSTFLDKKKKLVIPKNHTILDLKGQLYSKFPGSPPIELQKLYFNSRYLSDYELIGNISMLSPLPILLDMISGTSVYNKSMSVSQALEAYISTVIQQAFIGFKLQSLYSHNSNNNINNNSSSSSSAITVMDTIYFRELLMSMNQSLYDRYQADITAALRDEQEPEVVAADTLAWRSPSKKTMSPLTLAIAKEFDLNIRGIKNFLYYSIVLMVFAYFGTTTSSSTTALLFMIPVLWISKLRQLRLLSKIVLYTILPLVGKFDFLLPLLPAPLQVIALQTNKWLLQKRNQARDDRLRGDASKWMKRMRSRFVSSSSGSSSRSRSIMVKYLWSRVSNDQDNEDDDAADVGGGDSGGVLNYGEEVLEEKAEASGDDEDDHKDDGDDDDDDDDDE